MSENNSKFNVTIKGNDGQVNLGDNLIANFNQAQSQILDMMKKLTKELETRTFTEDEFPTRERNEILKLIPVIREELAKDHDERNKGLLQLFNDKLEPYKHLLSLGQLTMATFDLFIK